jgi:hypothetical protein
MPGIEDGNSQTLVISHGEINGLKSRYRDSQCFASFIPEQLFIN